MATKFKISAPFFTAMKTIQSDAKTVNEFVALLNSEYSVSLDFRNYTLVVNGTALKPGDALPDAPRQMVEISEANNESGNA